MSYPPRQPSRRPRADDVDPAQYERLRARRPRQPRYAREFDDRANNNGGRFAGFMLVLCTAALVIVHGLWQATAPEAAGRTLRAVLPPLTDLDQTLAANREVLRELALGEPPGGPVTVPGLPLTVQISREDALSDDTAALRATVLMGMSDRLYESGAAAFRSSDARGGEPSMLSSQWVLQGTLNLLTRDRHDTLRLPWLGAIGATLVFAVCTLLLLEGPSRLLGPGVSLLVGSLLGALAAGVARGGALLFFGNEDVVDGVVRHVVRDTAMTVVVVALILGTLGLVVTVLGLIVRRLDVDERSAAAPARPPVRR